MAMNPHNLDTFCAAGPISRLPAFDNTLTTLNERGEHVRFILSPLDSSYIYPPKDDAPPGMLPPEEHEVRANLLRISVTHALVAKMPWVDIFLSPKSFFQRIKDARLAREHLNACLHKSPAHLKAFERILNTLAPDTQERLKAIYLGKQGGQS